MVKSKPIKIAVAGTHSTGKSTFVEHLLRLLSEVGLKVGRIGDLATQARDRGFPILTDHNYYSTLWIMAEGLKQEAERSLDSEIILVDRPIFDAMGYLEAALEISGRCEDENLVEELRKMAEVHSQRYDFVAITVLDLNIPLGEGRDTNAKFRKAAAKHIDRLATLWVPNAIKLTSENFDGAVKKAMATALSQTASF